VSAHALRCVGHGMHELITRLLCFQGSHLGCKTADICDAGRTEVASGTRAVAAFGLAPCSAIDSITGKLELRTGCEQIN